MSVLFVPWIYNYLHTSSMYQPQVSKDTRHQFFRRATKVLGTTRAWKKICMPTKALPYIHTLNTPTFFPFFFFTSLQIPSSLLLELVLVSFRSLKTFTTSSLVRPCSTTTGKQLFNIPFDLSSHWISLFVSSFPNYITPSLCQDPITIITSTTGSCYLSSLSEPSFP